MNTTNDVRPFLAGEKSAEEVEGWLQSQFVPSIVQDINKVQTRRRFGLYGGDKIPTNERNLTDTRNRVSLILEYVLGQKITEAAEELGAGEYFCSYVVANRFPDLEIRDANGSRGVRLEVKCLQSVAEEKSANFATLLKDIHPTTDFLVVFLWEWDQEKVGVEWDGAPYVYQTWIFHAGSLAWLRDWYWLNRPPSDLGNGYQGFDLRYPVNCKNGAYNEEEGNLGKILRLWGRDVSLPADAGNQLIDTEAKYTKFKSAVANMGMWALARSFLSKLDYIPQLKVLHQNGNAVGYYDNGVGFAFTSKMNNNAVKQAMKAHNLRRFIKFSDRYIWHLHRVEGAQLVKVDGDKKPKWFRKDHLED